jgi:radical SAM family uncharacterized protein/radical SAM-linked protein
MKRPQQHSLLPLLPRPSHYLGTEYNAIHKDLVKTSLHWGLAFPDLYEVGMSHLGLKILYHILNAQSEIWAERVFAPSLEAGRILQKQAAPLTTLESNTPLAELDILGFSLTHELCYTSVLYMLDLAQIPFRSLNRDDRWPLLIGGGGVCVNPEPMAPFFDLFVVGDGEEIVLEISQTVVLAKQAGRTRRELLTQLARIPGIYVPSLFHGFGPEHPQNTQRSTKLCIEKRVIRDLNTAPFPTQQIVPFGQAVHDRLTLEIARGCTRGCRFCQAGMTMRPVRERNLSELDQLLREGLDNTGFEEFSFLSLSTGDFSQLEALFAQSLARCHKEQVAISLPSLRVGSLSPGLMRSMASLRRTGATLAPEAGSQRLRNVINKGISEQELLKHTEDLFTSGWRRLKLYFMIGLPTESYQDLQAIYDLCLKVLETAGPGKKKIQLTASIAIFVPKPHTPFQWEAQDDPETAGQKIVFLQNLFRRPKNLTLRWHDPEMSAVEGVFSRGDSSLASVVETAYTQGDILTSWQEHFDYRLWEKALSQHELSLLTWLGPRPEDKDVPWSHINCGIRPAYLLQERKKAWEEAITLDCRYHGCSQCGVCSVGQNPGELIAQASSRPIRPVVNQRHRDQEASIASTPPPDEPEQEEQTTRLILEFAKQGPAAYLSQLELQTVFERIFRRAGLPLSFSRGFHPMPRISFGRALPVGVYSETEFCLLVLRRPVEMTSVCARLNRVSISGLRFTQAEERSPGQKPTQPRFEHFLLQLHFPGQEAKQCIQSWMEAASAPSWIVERKTRKGLRQVDLGPRIHSLSQMSSKEIRITFDWEAGYVNPLFFVRSLAPGLNPRKYTMTKIKTAGPKDNDF